MQFDPLSADDRAVASMLGMTLLLGTAVVGAAVVGAFVLDVGGSQETAPQVIWEWEETPDGLTVQHDGGDTVMPGEVRVVGDVDADLVGTTLDDPSLFGDEPISAGDEAAIDDSRLSGDTGTVALVWTSSDGSQSVVLSEYEYELR
ncbi:MAG TPA: type IV pilin [Natronoarchaeum rubrum]|nr:type IV pilin [Natronoarchaeum rubrum]